MALVHLLYRCPRCEADAMEGRGDRAICGSCSASFRRDRHGADLLVELGRARYREPTSTLADRVRDGPTDSHLRSDVASLTSEARLHGVLQEGVVRRRGCTLGFYERPGPGVPGLLHLSTDVLSFRPEGSGRPSAWPLDRMTALQVASRSLQIGMKGLGTLQLTFPEASTLRWERALQEGLRRVWRTQGRGEIVEFQPRIVAG